MSSLCQSAGTAHATSTSVCIPITELSSLQKKTSQTRCKLISTTEFGRYSETCLFFSILYYYLNTMETLQERAELFKKGVDELANKYQIDLVPIMQIVERVIPDD